MLTKGVIQLETAALVLVSEGGHPKDINLYQASKALLNAKEAVNLFYAFRVKHSSQIIMRNVKKEVRLHGLNVL